MCTWCDGAAVSKLFCHCAGVEHVGVFFAGLPFFSVFLPMPPNL